AVGFLVTVFWCWDRRAYARESVEARALKNPQRSAILVEGKINLLIAAGIIACSASGMRSPWREATYAVLMGLSLTLTPTVVRDANGFHYGPLKEVGVLFLGIFVTMVPALHALEQIAPKLPVHTPIGLFLMSGALSSVLDNAPTYLLFASLAAARA